MDDPKSYRPQLPDSMTTDEVKVIVMMKECWSQDIRNRPDVFKIKKRLKTMNKGR